MKPKASSTTMLAFAKRKRANVEIDRRRRDLKTYMEPLDELQEPDLKDFLSDFSISKRQVEMQQIFLEYPAVHGFYRELVPSLIEHEDFWQRYYYRTDSAERVLQDLDKKDVEKLKLRSASVKDSWSTTVPPHTVLNQYSTNLKSLRKLTPLKKKSSTAKTGKVLWPVAGNENTTMGGNGRNVEPYRVPTLFVPQPPQPSFHKENNPGRYQGVTSTGQKMMKNQKDETTTSHHVKWAQSQEEQAVEKVEPTPSIDSEETEPHKNTIDDEKNDTIEDTKTTGVEVKVEKPCKTTTKGFWLLLLTLLGIGCGILAQQTKLMNVHGKAQQWIGLVQDGFCGPIAPWTRLTHETPSFEREAPWFAPGYINGFDVVCGQDRVRTLLKWHKGILTIVDAAHPKKRLLKKQGLQSATVYPQEIRVHDGRKMGAVALPWQC